MTPEEREDDLDVIKINFLKKNNTSLISSLMFNIKFAFSDAIPTAATNGVEILFNPDFYDSLDKDSKMFVLRHELEHIVRLHIPRSKTLSNMEVWNIATDLIINQTLVNEGWEVSITDQLIFRENMDFPGIKRNFEKEYNEEAIYYHILNQLNSGNKDTQVAMQKANGSALGDDIKNNGSGSESDDSEGEGSSNGGSDKGDQNDSPFSTNPTESEMIQKISEAVTADIMANGLQAGSYTASIKEMVDGYLEPIVPMEELLVEFFTELGLEDYTFKKPNRRSNEFVLPSLNEEEGRLDHLMYFIDVSGSISNKQIKIFKSEIKHVFDVIRPRKMTIVQFDTSIKQTDTFDIDFDDLDDLEIIGRGGTCLIDVRAMIDEHMPTAAVIFSDLYVTPMEPLEEDIPLVWIVVDNPNVEVKAGGDIFHIKEREY